MITIKKFFNKVFNIIISGTLAKRLILLLLIGIILPIILMTYINIRSTFDKMVNQYTEKNLSNISFLSKIMGDYYNDINNIPMNFFTSSDVLRPILNGANGGYINSIEVYDYLKNFLYNRHDIDSIYLYTAGNGTLSYLDRTKTSDSFNGYVNINDLSKYIPEYNKLSFTNRFYISSLKEDNNQRKNITQNQLILNFDNKSILAVLSINFNTNFFDEQSKNLNLKEDEVVLALDKDYHIMYQFGASNLSNQIMNKIINNNFSQDKGLQYIKTGAVKYLSTYCWNTNKQYLFIKITPVNYIYKEVISLFYSDIYVIIIFLILFVIISFSISNSISKPIKKIVENMKRIEKGNFKIKIDIKTHSSELILLIDKFNLMAEEIDRLFNETYKMEIAQKTAELNALQAQINPHFLYNTLQTIQGMALKRNAYEIEKMVNALGDILKYSLRNESNIVTLKEEMAYVDKFLLIQRFKYINNLSVNIQFDQDTANLKVPKMILQPLIENCFIHGFDSRKDKFILDIKCTNNENFISIEISDNGKGIDPKRLKKIRSDLNQNVINMNYSGIEIGLLNVNYRLGILFRNQAKIEINSVPLENTTIILTIPYI